MLRSCSCDVLSNATKCSVHSKIFVSKDSNGSKVFLLVTVKQVTEVCCILTLAGYLGRQIKVLDNKG